ncbi:MAG: hypothetical protein EU541_05420 [Promethearchaeota archaeon]|nr:MAG: hypothetical protein EU541_05420 [Candidatus Lokiarchaeota archaeon]
MKTYKSDISPVGFFFDIFSNELFHIPILPLPMRIDKVIKGETTYFIRYDIETLNEISEKFEFSINFNSFIRTGINNLIKFMKENYLKISSFKPKKQEILKWFHDSFFLELKCPDLIEDFTYLVSAFLKTFQKISENNLKNPENVNFLLLYCEDILNYYQNKLEKNVINIEQNGKIEQEKIYISKKSKIYPRIVEADMTLSKLKSDKIISKKFVPYLIYDDIIETFYYNKKLLKEKNKAYFNLNLYLENGIIIKGSKTYKHNSQIYSDVLYTIILNDLELL